MQPNPALAVRAAKAPPLVVFASLSLVLVLSACGGGGGDTDTPLTLDSLRAEADAVSGSRLPAPDMALADCGTGDGSLH